MANYFNTEAGREKVLKRFSMFDNAGLDISNCTEYGEALEQAGLNYSAVKKEMFLENGIKVPDKFAIVKSDDESKVLGVVGNQYVPVSNEDAFDIAEELVNEGEMKYEVAGPSLEAGNIVDYARSFMVLRGDDFEVNGDTFNSFVVFNNSFDGSCGVKYSVITQRLACLNGLTRYLGGKKNQLYINIQHSKQAIDRIAKARQLIISYRDEISVIQKEAQIFSKIHMTREDFESKIIPFVLKAKNLYKTEDKEITKGTEEKINTIVSQLIQAYNADDVQNYENSAYRTILALSDYETHSAPLRETGNGHVYMNRILQGMTLTTAVAQYIVNQYATGARI